MSDSSLKSAFVTALIAMSQAQQAWAADRAIYSKGKLDSDKEIETALQAAGYVVKPGIQDEDHRRLFVADVVAY